MSIFNYLSYFEYLDDTINSAARERGYKRKVAEAAGCQASYLSLVMKSVAHLTLEQAERLSRFWRMTPEESEYFLLLVCHGRAGSPELRDHFHSKLKKLKEQNENLGKRIRDAEVFPDAEAAIYYSSWQYIAVHILVSIPEFQSIPEIARRLQLPEDGISRVLSFLEKLGVVVNQSGKWRNSGKQFHLPKESPFVSLNHGNWRRRAVDNAFIGRPGDLHYTGVSSLAKKDAEKLRQVLLRVIDESRAIISPSPEEELICLGLDFFVV